MKILLIAYHFPPDRAVGGIRAGRLVKSLVDRGHTVHVLAGPLSGEPTASSCGGFTVERLKPLFDARKLSVRFKRRFQRQEGPRLDPACSPAVAWIPPTSVPRWKRYVSAALWLPDDRQGWMAAAALRGWSLTRGQVDLIYTTAPPFSGHLAGLGLKLRNKNVRWVAEFRDPWTDNPSKPAFVRARWSDAIERRLENICLRHADSVVCVTQSAARLLRLRMGNDADKVSVIRNGIDGPMEGTTVISKGNGRILYAGNLYHARDPRPFLEALAALQAREALPPAVKAEFVGDCQHFHGVSVRHLADTLGLADRVIIRDPVPHEDCIVLMQEASALLLLAKDQPLQVPNKLYEYLSVGRPILAIADADGETAQILSMVGGHQLADGSDRGQLEAAICEVLSGAGSAGRPTVEVLQEWSTDRQLAQLTALVEEKKKA